VRSFTAAYVQDDGSTAQVRVTGKDVRAWEAMESRAWYDGELSDTQLAQVVGLAAIRAGLWHSSVEAFVAGNDEAYQVRDGGAGGGPT
jgi:hypothetical protein